MILLVEHKELKQKNAQWILPSVFAEGIFIGVQYATKNTFPSILTIELDGLLYAVPLRHHIKHPYAFKTIGEAGLDYTKSVIITAPLFLSDDKPTIESAEFAIIKREEQKIRYGLKKYINQYRRAMRHRGNPRSSNILKYSTLKYFEDYL